MLVVGGCIVYTVIRLLRLIRPSMLSFFFLYNFQRVNCLSHFSLEMVNAYKLKLGTHTYMNNELM